MECFGHLNVTGATAHELENGCFHVVLIGSNYSTCECWWEWKLAVSWCKCSPETGQVGLPWAFTSCTAKPKLNVHTLADLTVLPLGNCRKETIVSRSHRLGIKSSVTTWAKGIFHLFVQTKWQKLTPVLYLWADEPSASAADVQYCLTL